MTESKMEEYAKAGAGNFLNAKKVKDENLNGKQLTISEVGWQEMKDGNEKPVIKFAETESGLVLNKGNTAVLMEAFGADETKWKSKELQLVVTKTQYQGALVDSITVVVPSK